MKQFATIIICVYCTFFSYQKGVAQTPLDEFKKIDSSLKKANTILSGSVGAFDTIKNLSPEVYAALRACQKLDGHINVLKAALSRKPEEDTRFTNQLFITRGEGKKLQTQLKQCKMLALKAVQDSISRQNITQWLTTDVPVAAKKNWAVYYFKDVPAVAAITILSKFQNDLLNCRRLITSEKKP